MFKILTFSFFLLHVYGVQSETVDLTVADGPIRGLVNTTTRTGVTYHAYRGIPYAKPPIGNLRFASPQKNSPWNGTLDATQDKNECVTFESYIGTTVYGQEDCLYINVYTPNVNNTSALPIVVWIHGGGFLAGNSSYDLFGPDYFLEEGVLFISFNYRLGIFGFLSTEDEVCPGNWGIKDQVLALKWVQTNAGYFGGDPNNVTIFGESAGAASVSLLMQTQQTAGLFHKTIMNSGTTLNLWSLNTRASETAALVATSLGIISTDSTTLVAGLRGVDANQLQLIGMNKAFGLFVTNAFRGLPYAPVLEPNTVTDAVFTTPSDDTLVAGNFHRVPVLMGFNSNEAAGFASISAVLRLYLLNYDVLSQYLTPFSMTSNLITRLLVGTQIKLHYFGLLPITLNNDNIDEFIGDDQFNRPIRRAAQVMSRFTDVYLYVFGYEPGTNAYEGVAHADDLKYLFRTGTPPSDPYGTDVSKTMVKLWSTFIKQGNPTPYADAALNNTIWPAINSSSSNVSYLSINATLSVQVNPKQAMWTYYQTLFNTYGDDSYTTY